MAIGSFLGRNQRNTGTIWLCLGSSFQAIGSIYFSKIKKETDDHKDQ